MSEERQVAEMAETLETAKINALATVGSLNDGFGMWYARAMYDAGYRRKSGATDENVGRKSEWISVEERLPDNCRAVLVALEGLTIGGAPAMVIGSYSGGFWMVADADGTHYLTKYMRYKVTHWMPLPEPPKL